MMFSPARALLPVALAAGAVLMAGAALAQGSAPAYGPNMEIRLEELERRIQVLTGQVEELQYSNGQLADRLERALNDIEFRLVTLEGGTPAPREETGDAGAAPVGGQVAGAPAAPAGGEDALGSGGSLGTLASGGAPQAPEAVGGQPVSLPGGDVAQQYDYAYGLLSQGDYVGAEAALQQFLQQHGDDPLASNAQYWLGETYYVRGRYGDAAVAFARGYQQFPNGAKAIDSMLKLGMALGAEGQTQDACLTFRQLETQYPTAPSAIQRRVQQERQRLACP